MKYYLGVADNEWYSYLSERENEDINFWQPGGNSIFRAIEPGSPFLFKLKSPINAIGGLGFFSSHSILPLNVAWNIFEERNGVASYFHFKNKIIAYRNRSNPFKENQNIGCIVLTDPIFFKPVDWIMAPLNWSKSIVQGKTYDTNEKIGKDLWHRVEILLSKANLLAREESHKNQFILEDPLVQYSKKFLTKVRLGQGAFRVRLTDAYQRKCAISGERTLPALEAAHIKPYSESGPHYLSNGILVRADIHKLFDSGYITLTRDRRVFVSKKIKEEFHNGKDYYKFHGQNLLSLPVNTINHPDPIYIDWHNQNVYNG